jgi:hypothetical protein
MMDVSDGSEPRANIVETGRADKFGKRHEFFWTRSFARDVVSQGDSRALSGLWPQRI